MIVNVNCKTVPETWEALLLELNQSGRLITTNVEENMTEPTIHWRLRGKNKSDSQKNG